ncbi:MAG: hypothetical protein SWY16_15130 [Cyanobacteriota bacterium]|nr:hypothetical protein [Cyanobacteriota bacterium]
MKPSLSSILPFKEENKCPDCVVLDLEGNSIVPKQRFLSIPFNIKNDDNEQIKLQVTLNFNEQWESVGVGRIKFGLAGGELRLKLQNGEIPFEDRQFTAPLSHYIQTERQESQGHKNRLGIEPALTESKVGAKASFSTEQTDSATDKFQIANYQVTTKGSKENPVWDFKVQTGDSVLKFQLGKTDLGTLTVTGKPCHIEATFEASNSNIKITDKEGPWCVNLIPEKREALDKAFIKLLLKKKLKPYISRVELAYV